MNTFHSFKRQQRGGGRGKGWGRARSVQRDKAFPHDRSSDSDASIRENRDVVELKALRRQAAQLHERLQAVHSAIDASSSSTTARAAIVDASVCVGCGRCVPACPVNAIRMSNTVAEIDHRRCTGCGACVQACPKQAIFLKTVPVNS